MENQVSEVEKSFLERKLNKIPLKEKKEKSCWSWDGNGWKSLFYHFNRLRLLSVCLHSRMFSVDIFLSSCCLRWRSRNLSQPHTFHLILSSFVEEVSTTIESRRVATAMISGVSRVYYLKWIYDFWLWNVSLDAAFLSSRTMPNSLESRFFIIMQVSCHENWTLFVNHL